jgi:hypothetical protein
LQRFTWTGFYARRLFALGEPVNAQITFLHNVILVELDCAIGTSLSTGFTTGTLLPVNNHDAILRSLSDGSGWASLHAARLATVHARERDGSTDQVGIVTGP